MLRLFPKGRSEWLRVVLFPFQAYVAVAYAVEQYFMRSLPGHGGYRGSLTAFKLWVISGYSICFIVLLAVGIFQLSKRRQSGCLNIGLALLGAMFGLSMMNFVST